MANSLQNSTQAVSAVGIDVAKGTLSICRRYSDGKKEINSIRNNETDITSFIKQNLSGYQNKVIMESTGRYHYLAAITFSEKGFDARVINPLITKKYSTGSVRKVKSDARDAEVLAEIAIKEEKLPHRFTANRKDLEIRKKIGLLGSLEKQIQQLTSVLRDYVETKEQLRIKMSITEKSVLKTIKQLKRAKEKLEIEISGLANISQPRSEIALRYETIPGVSKYMSAVAAYFFDITEYSDDRKQWIAYAGLDVSVKQSGKWFGRGKLTKRGNPYLRKRLFCAAWGAIMHDQQFRNYYDYLRKNGRSYVEALTIISRKIVRIMFHLAKNNSLYDSNLLNLPTAN
jgi:transposase